MSDLHDVTQTPPVERDEQSLPWDSWSRERRQWTAYGVAGGLLLLGVIVGFVALWS
jgi:hypothetical protein